MPSSGSDADSDEEIRQARKGALATMDELSFADLVDAARRGDFDAARRLIALYEPAVRREVRLSILDGRLRRVIEESDVLQSVLGRFFLDLYAGRFDFDGPQRLAALLKEMVRAKVADRARYWKAARRDHRRDRVPDPEAPHDPSDGGPSPSRIVEDAEILANFEGGLTDEERAILALRREGLRWPEVSARLGNGEPDAVRKRFERAVARVAKSLGLEE